MFSVKSKHRTPIQLVRRNQPQRHFKWSSETEHDFTIFRNTSGLPLLIAWMVFQLQLQPHRACIAIGSLNVVYKLWRPYWSKEQITSLHCVMQSRAFGEFHCSPVFVANESLKLSVGVVLKKIYNSWAKTFIIVILLFGSATTPLHVGLPLYTALKAFLTRQKAPNLVASRSARACFNTTGFWVCEKARRSRLNETSCAIQPK